MSPSDISWIMAYITEIMAKEMSASKMTSIPVRSEVLQELRVRKTGGKTWDEFLLELLEEYDPPEWLAELERRRKKGRWLPAGELERVHEGLRRRGR
jgi:hypothetical protein